LVLKLTFQILHIFVFEQTAVFEANPETELQKAATEVKELREEEIALRQENIKLKVSYF
jgi:hypothetical protein